MEKHDTQFKLRLPSDLKERLDRAANAEGRSLSAEILFRLEKSFPAIEAEILNQRMVELQKLKASIEMATHELDTQEQRLLRGEWKPYGQSWLNDVIKNKKSHLQRLQDMADFVARDVELLAGDNKKPRK